MQHSPYEIKEKLLQALDQEYNVVDMATVFEVITSLEKAIITKEALEKTRIGKYINELRKRTNNEQLARRAKELVKSWRKLLPTSSSTRVNGEVISSLGVSHGSMTLLGPGPEPGFGPGPGPGNRILKTCVSVPVTPRYKSSSPSVMGERSSSPYFSSASNSPLFNSSGHPGSSLPFASNYAPVKITGGHISARTEKVNSVNRNLLNLGNQSKIISSQMFKPVSPSNAGVKQANSVLSGTHMPSQKHCSPNVSPGPHANSHSCSPVSPSANLCSQSVSLADAYGSSHSTLDIAKTNAANKRLRKDLGISNNCTTSKDQITSNFKSSNIGNGMSTVSGSILPSESSAFKSVNLSNFKSTINSDKSPVVTNLKSRKRKKSFDKNELHENAKEGTLASLSSSSKLQKVKTTQQLIAELQAKKGMSSECLDIEKKKGIIGFSSDYMSSVNSLHSSKAEVSRTKSELLKKFLNSSQSARSNSSQESPTGESGISTSMSDFSSPRVPESCSVISTNKGFQAIPTDSDPVNDEIIRILSDLPPLILDEINLEDDAASPVSPPSVTSDDLSRLAERWEYVNGVFDCNGTWRPWQECCEQISYSGETLRILPYVNIE